MDNNQNELSPQELLKKLKDSLNQQPSAQEEFKVPSIKIEAGKELSDAEILSAKAEQIKDALAIPEQSDSAPTIRYRFQVRRPEGAISEDTATDAPDEQTELPPIPDTDELLPDTNTAISFTASDAPDVNALMGELLSAAEIAQLQRIGSMPNAQAIADQAKEEAQTAYEQAQSELENNSEPMQDQMPTVSTEEIETVYEGSQEYYTALVNDALEPDQASDATDDEAQDTADQFIPDETSRLNAMNYITSLTKKAAQQTAAEAAEPTEPADVAADDASDDTDDIADDVQTDESEPEQGVQEQDAATPEEYDEVDVNLMLAFGMEDKLKDAVGEDEAQKLRAQADEDAKTMTSTDIFKAVNAEEKQTVEEFTDYSQTKGIFASFKKRYRKTLFSLGGAILLAIIAFFYENLPALGGALPQALDKGYYPLVNIMFGLQLCVLAYALVFGQCKRAFAALLARKWIPEIGTALTVVLSFIYQILIAIFCRASFTTYDFPVILCVVFALIYEFMNVKREIYSFNVIASKKMKYALCPLPAQDAQQERDAFAPFYEGSADEADGVSEEDGSEQISEQAEPQPVADRPMYQLKRGAFIDGFFEKLNRYPSYQEILKILIPAAAIVSLCFLIIGAIRVGSFSYGVSCAYFVLALIAPMSMFITYSYPLYKASRNAFRTDTAILGERAAEEYLDAEEISFEDKDIFPAKGVKVKSIKVYGAHRIDRVVFNAANIFRKYGGPLAQVFNMATLELGTTDEVYFGVIEENGIEAMVGGSHIYLGKADYLRGKGYEPGFDDEDEVIEGNGGICVMFMAIEDEVAAKFYVEYTLDPEFESILRSLYTSGVCIGVRTYDPNIDNRMLQLLLRYEDYPVRVIKCRTEQSPNLAREHMDSGIVSRRSVKDMLRAYMSCDRVLRTIRLGVILKMAAMAVGTVIGAIVVGFAGVGIASVWAVLYQLLWVLPLLAVTRLTV